MESFIYFFLSIIDSLAALFLMFKIFRFPIKEYLKELILISIIISIESYLMRIVFDIPSIDPILQFWIYILSLRYIVKVRLVHSLLISLAGYLGFMAIQLSTYFILLFTGVSSLADSKELFGLGTYLIQVSSEVMCFLIAFLIYRYNNGFSFILRPPHDMYLKQSIGKWTIIGMISGNIVLYITLYWILNFHTIFIIPIVVLMFISLIYISYKRDNKR